MGQAKLMLPWGDGRLIDGVVDAWQDAGVEAVVAVVHPQDEALAEYLRGRGAAVVVPNVPPPEMKDSVRIALEYVESSFHPNAADVWLLAPADMPCLSAAVARRVIAAASEHPGAIILPVHRGRKGHPALFPWPLAAEVRRLADDEGVNALLARHAAVCIECGAEALPADVDTPADYHRQSGR